MSGFLLDTNCISELVRPKPEPRVMEWMEAADEAILYLSVLTVGEIRKGLAGLTQGKRRTRLEAWLEVGPASQILRENCADRCGDCRSLGLARRRREAQRKSFGDHRRLIGS